MIQNFILVILCIVAVVFVYAEAAAACNDELGSHCEVFRQFCFDEKWASLKTKCAATCGLC